MAEKKYKAAIYLRLSKEDGDKEESYSISNQRDLAMDFLSKHSDIFLVDEMIDDGYTGSNFQRPSFKKMIDKVSKGEINCVIVKDLSRFARDYIGSGYYLEKLFPSMGVRFISINDNIDYKVDNSADTRLIMAFKNVLNDSYIHDISVKIRSQFEIKRKKGEYIGAFVVYGYQKSPEDKHKLIIDKNAAEIVRNIFNQRMHGISANAIADKLNLLSVPSPAEHKRLCGSNFSANLQKKYTSKWSAKAVIRILTNEIYTGTLIQGKRTTVNYKVKKVVEKDESEWSIIQNSHEPIITQEQFDIVQNLIKHDTRVTPDKKEPYLFSGFVECADCHSPLVRRTSKYKGTQYVYYMCSTNKLGMGCSSHRVNETALYTSVLETINLYCKNVSCLSDKMNKISFEAIMREQLAQIDKSIREKQSSAEDLRRTVTVVQSRYINNLETKEVCDEICSDIQAEITMLNKEIECLQDEKAKSMREHKLNTMWLKVFSEYGNISELNRSMLAHLVERIYVYEDKRITVKLKYQDKYEQLLMLTDRINTEKEAV